MGSRKVFFLIFFCVSRRKWKSEVIFPPLIVWSCSIELDGYSHIQLNGSRISNNSFPLEYHSVSGFPFCGDVSVSWMGSCRLLVIWNRKKRSNGKIITFLLTSGKSDSGLLMLDANGEPSGPCLSSEAVQNIWRGLYCCCKQELYLCAGPGEAGKFFCSEKFAISSQLGYLSL